MGTLERKQTGVGTRAALLVIDASRAFTSPNSALGMDGTNVVEAILKVLDKFRELGLPIFYTTVAYDSPDQAPVFRERLPALEMLSAGSNWVDIDPRIAPRDDEPVIVKHFPSGFFETDLADRLASTGVDTVYVTGLTTSGCVRATVVDALSHDFRVVVPREAVADRDSNAHEANLHDIDCKYGDVVSVERALAALS